MRPRRYTAAGGVVVRGDRVLVLDRPARCEVRLPKGHVEAGESACAAALRETAEETGYGDLVVLADLGRQQVSFEYQGVRIVRQERFFLMRLDSERRVSRPEKDAAQFVVRWLALVEAPRALSFKAERIWLARAVLALLRARRDEKSGAEGRRDGLG